MNLTTLTKRLAARLALGDLDTIRRFTAKADIPRTRLGQTSRQLDVEI